MRVLHIIPSVAQVRGGPSQAVLEMVSALRLEGVDAEIATTNDNGPTVLEVPCRQKINYSVGLAAKNGMQVPVRFFERRPVQSGPLSEFLFSPSLTHWLWHHVPDYDLLHVHALFSYPSTAAMAIARWHQVPYLIRPIGQLCHWPLTQSATKKKAYLALIERDNLQKAKGIHFTTEQELEEASALNLTSSDFVVPHGVHLPTRLDQPKAQLRRRLNIPEASPILLFLSRLHPKKGLDRLIAALRHVDMPPFHLVIAGSGDPGYEAKIDRQLHASGLAARVHRVGFVTGERKQQLLQGADVFVLPSHSENFGVAVLEALAAGLPVMTSPQVALSPLIQDHNLGWVCDNTVEALTQTLQQTLTETDRYDAMGQRARQVARAQFSWPKIAHQLSQAYEQCAAISNTPVNLETAQLC